MRKILTTLILLVSATSFGQVGVNGNPPEATLDIQAVKNGNVPDGVLIPRIDREWARTMTKVKTSTLVYIDDATSGDASGQAEHIDAEGFYYFKDNKWVKLGGGVGGDFWSLKGNKNITEPALANKDGGDYTINNKDKANFVGTTDTKKLTIATENMARLEIGKITGQTVQSNSFEFVLDVFGKARFRKGIVTAASNYPDYVFEKYFTGASSENPDYTFKKLDEVEKFIKENNHLPGVTSIKDLNKSKEGYEIDNTQLSIQTLEKVEELYLYIIEQQKQIEALKAEIAKLRK